MSVQTTIKARLSHHKADLAIGLTGPLYFLIHEKGGLLLPLILAGVALLVCLVLHRFLARKSLQLALVVTASVSALAFDIPVAILGVLSTDPEAHMWLFVSLLFLPFHAAPVAISVSYAALAILRDESLLPRVQFTPPAVDAGALAWALLGAAGAGVTFALLRPTEWMTVGRFVAHIIVAVAIARQPWTRTRKLFATLVAAELIYMLPYAYDLIARPDQLGPLLLRVLITLPAAVTITLATLRITERIRATADPAAAEHGADAQTDG